MGSLRDIFKNFNLTSINLSMPFMSTEITFLDADKEAAWALYIEFITRTAIQPLPDEAGVEKTALESLYSIFPTTREILKQYGRKGKAFSKIAIIVLNQVIRPFTTKWHRIALSEEFENYTTVKQFREELCSLQNDLQKFIAILAQIAEFDDISFQLSGGAHLNEF